jgi:hypothetical protein
MLLPALQRGRRLRRKKWKKILINVSKERRRRDAIGEDTR